MTTPTTNRVLAHTGARYPIIQAPMGWIARTQLASAVSRAGGLGIIETSSGETANCQAEITKMSALGLPFGVNLPIRFLKDDAMLRFVCASGVKFVTTSAGSPAKFIAPLKDAGITVYHAVPTVETARSIVYNVNRADCFYPNSSFNALERKRYLTLAIADCEQLMLDMQCLMDIGLPVNANRFEALAGMVEEEIKLLKGARKNVRVTGKKTTDERIAEAEAELERLRSL